ncbi:hypothetical protein [Acidicapsa ligni]|uniref:hypothetical protein n=1 Tax=Acidicapsa ligni TaxID=542300 RepID=UPI0021DFF794|nr:hypothetical protein [Acidicapsa ligni]
MAESESVRREHTYHAEAKALIGHLTLPLNRSIEPQVFLSLPQAGGYNSQRTGKFHLEQAISFESAYTEVAGNKETKPGHGWSTLATSVIEGLNILEIVTADRVVAQISTEHPLIGHVPTINFLGTRFENLRIAGHPVHLDLDLKMLGPKPEQDAPYTSNRSLSDRIAQQRKRILKDENLPEEVRQGYNRPEENKDSGLLECSLVNQVNGTIPGHAAGHVIHVPNFGTIHLAAVHVHHEDFQKGTPHRTTVGLNMIEAHMGCVAAGKVGVATTKTNGVTRP